MIRIAFTALACAALLGGCGGVRSPDRSGPLVFRHLTLLDGTGAPPRPGMTLIVERDRILTVGPDDSVRIPPAARVVDARGRFAMPGLWDMHVHLSKARAGALPVLVGNGVTSVRDMGGDPVELKAWRDSIRGSHLVGPEIRMAGPMLESPAVRERLEKSGTHEDWRHTRVFLSDPASARSLVDSLAALGVDFIKVREIHTPEVVAAVAEACRARGIRVAGHAPYALDPVRGAALGMASFEHASYPYPLDPDPEERARVLGAFVAHGVAIVPTLVAWRTNLMDLDSLLAMARDTLSTRDPRLRLVSPHLAREWRIDLEDRKPKSVESLRGWREFFETTCRDLRAMHEAGIPILPGSDLATAGLVPGYSLQDELELLVRHVGLSPMEAIECATRMPAEFFGVSEEKGTLEAGKRADLVLLDADPLREIRNTRRIVGVVLAGRYFDTAQVRELLSGLPPTAAGTIALEDAR